MDPSEGKKKDCFEEYKRIIQCMNDSHTDTVLACIKIIYKWDQCRKFKK